jgi:hypothetical protein
MTWVNAASALGEPRAAIFSTFRGSDAIWRRIHSLANRMCSNLVGLLLLIHLHQFVVPHRPRLAQGKRRGVESVGLGSLRFWTRRAGQSGR